MRREPGLKIYSDAETLYTAAADFFVELVQKTVKKTGRFSVALSGGGTPKPFYTLLKSPAYKSEIPWHNLYIFWGDERYVSSDSPENNAHVAQETFLNDLPIPNEQIFPMPILSTPAQSAASYEKTLQTFFKDREPKFDLILLGIGPDSHTASLFPHTEVLNEKQHWVRSVFVEKLNMHRITLTPVIINQADKIIFLVTEAAKEPAISATLYGPKNPQEHPTQLIQPINGELIWYLSFPLS